MRPTLQRTLLVSWIAALLVASLADDAEAQRRRRRPRPRPIAAQPAETPNATGDEGEDDDATPTTPPTTPTTPFGPTTPTTPTTTPPATPTTPTSPAATPAADLGPAPPDVSPIRSDYVALMDDLVQARMRVHALGNELFRTRIRVDLQDRTGGNVALARLVVHLDGAPIFQSDGPVERAAEGRELFTGALAPGPHVITLEVEQRAREDDAYRYTLRESFRFQVVRERLTELSLVLEDGSDIARSFPAGGEGRYEVRTRMRVATRALPAQ